MITYKLVIDGDVVRVLDSRDRTVAWCSERNDHKRFLREVEGDYGVCLSHEQREQVRS